MHFFGGRGYKERTSRFLSELLTDQTIEPRHVAAGHVVFPYGLDDDEALTLVISLKRAWGAPAEPAVGADSGAAEVIRLTFRFETD